MGTFTVVGDWLACEANGCTCQGSDAHYGHQSGCGYEPVVRLSELTSVLRDNGFAVVELPKASVNGEDNLVWTEPLYVEQQFGGDVVISDRLCVDKADLRPLAAALLAAADRAEAGE